jgi:uncharacterized protein (TIRG00374 family)
VIELMQAASTAQVLIARVRTVAIRTALGFGAGAIMIVAFLRLVNVSAVTARLSHLSTGYVLLCGVAFLGAYFVRAMRWRRLLKPYCEVGIGRAAAIYQVATFLNWLLPVRGGELAKSLLLRRTDGVPVSRSLATVAMDKTMDLLPALVLVALVPFVGLHLSRPLWVLLLSAQAVVLAAVVALALAAWRRDLALKIVTRLARVLPRAARERVEPFIVLFVDTLLELMRRPRLLLVAAAYTAVAVTFDALFCWLAFRAVGVTLSVPVALYGYTFFNLAFILPTPPGQVGSNELIGLSIFAGLFGVDRSGVGAMFLFSHPWTAVLMTISGLLCLSLMGLTLRNTLQLAREQAEEGRA